MNKEIRKYLRSFEFGKLHHFKNMGVIPLFTPLDDSPEYFTLKEVLDKQLLTITEVSQETLFISKSYAFKIETTSLQLLQRFKFSL